MGRKDIKIELLINPFCLCDRDVGVLGGICKKHGVTFIPYNLWEIDDEEVDGLPEYLANLITGWRSGEQPGSVYSDVFINGERFPIADWPKSFETIEERIVALLGGTER